MLKLDNIVKVYETGGEESWLGRFLIWSARPTFFSASSARRRRSPLLTPERVRHQPLY